MKVTIPDREWACEVHRVPGQAAPVGNWKPQACLHIVWEHVCKGQERSLGSQWASVRPQRALKPHAENV